MRYLIFICLIIMCNADFIIAQQRNCPCIAPMIINHPFVVPGQCVGITHITLSAASTGTAPFSYQWQENGVNIYDNAVFSGTNTADLVISSPPLSLNGKRYRCIISNCSGVNAATDNSCMLTLSALQSDINADGITNNADFAFLLTALNTSCTGCRSDINNDGVVNIMDFLLLLGEFNRSCN